MALTHKRAFMLTKIINADKERAKSLLRLEAEEVTAKINALGYDFKMEEIREYGKAIRNYMGGHVRDGELNEVFGGVKVHFPINILSNDKIRW